MPPVMGSVAFVMASFMNVPYADIMAAATVPALLFYLVLLIPGVVTDLVGIAALAAIALFLPRIAPPLY